MAPITLEELKELVVDLKRVVGDLVSTVGDLRVEIATSNTEQTALIEHVKGMEERFNKELAEAYAFACKVDQNLRDHQKQNTQSHTKLKMELTKMVERVGVQKTNWEDLKGIVIPVIVAIVTGIATYFLKP